MRCAWLLALLLLVAGCGDAPRGEAPATEKADDSEAIKPVPEATPSAADEPTAEEPWEPGRPIETHVAGWSCAMPGPGPQRRARERIESTSTLVGHVASSPDLERKRVAVTLSVRTPSALSVGDAVIIVQDFIHVAWGEIESIDGTRAVVELWSVDETSEHAWDRAQVRKIVRKKQG